jgi:hypothetical protein
MSIAPRLIARLFAHITAPFRADDGAPERLPSPNELVVLAHPGGEPASLMMQQMLADEGIHALVRNRDAATSRGGGWGPPWAYEVCVLRRDLRRAREIIGEPRA